VSERGAGGSKSGNRPDNDASNKKTGEDSISIDNVNGAIQDTTTEKAGKKMGPGNNRGKGQRRNDWKDGLLLTTKKEKP